MDLRPFLREHIAGRPMLVGAVFALTAGMSLGSYLKAGEMFHERPAPQMFIPEGYATGGDTIGYMTDANGRIPDYVIGTDIAHPPSIRTVWDDAPPPAEEPRQIAWTAPEPLPEPVYRPAEPPSIGGDILAIDAPPEPAPLG